MTEPKYPISDDDMLELLRKYPFLKHRNFWEQNPSDIYKNDKDNIEHNKYKIWDGTGWENLWKNRYLPRLFKEYDSWDEETKNNFYITDIKEKFGGLRIYCQSYTSDRLESIAEAISEYTCQYCGAEPRTKEGKRVIWTTGGWITNLCEDCARKYLLDYGIQEDKIAEELENMKHECEGFGYRQYSKDRITKVTYKETEDGWLEKDQEIELDPEEEKKKFIADLKGESVS